MEVTSLFFEFKSSANREEMKSLVDTYNMPLTWSTSYSLFEQNELTQTDRQTDTINCV